MRTLGNRFPVASPVEGKSATTGRDPNWIPGGEFRSLSFMTPTADVPIQTQNWWGPRVSDCDALQEIKETLGPIKLIQYSEICDKTNWRTIRFIGLSDWIGSLNKMFLQEEWPSDVALPPIVASDKWICSWHLSLIQRATLTIVPNPSTRSRPPQKETGMHCRHFWMWWVGAEVVELINSKNGDTLSGCSACHLFSRWMKS